MARIRTVKPDFFRHEGLYRAEVESGLPLRVAFVGLWTACDREGRFRWAPNRLKLDCLPYDEIDFSRVLHALITRGFVVKYEFNGQEFGYIPTWRKHQVINNRESDSEIPDPSKIKKMLTREPRVDDACPTRLMHAQGEGEREGKGNGVLLITAVDGISTTASEDEKSGEEINPEFKPRIIAECQRANVVDIESGIEIIARWIENGATPAFAIAALAEARKSMPTGDLKLGYVEPILMRKVEAEKANRRAVAAKHAQTQAEIERIRKAAETKSPPPEGFMAAHVRHS